MTIKEFLEMAPRDLQFNVVIIDAKLISAKGATTGSFCIYSNDVISHQTSAAKGSEQENDINKIEILNFEIVSEHKIIINVTNKAAMHWTGSYSRYKIK